MPLAFQVLYPSARDSGVLLPDVEADQGPQVPGVGLGDGPGAGQALQGRGRILRHQKCLPGRIWIIKPRRCSTVFLSRRDPQVPLPPL